MDPAILSATAALVGSLVGGVSTFAAYWLTQRVQLRAQSLMKRHAEREALYAEFIIEAPSGLRMPGVTTPKALKWPQVFFPPSSECD
jgi:hypothetical protein